MKRVVSVSLGSSQRNHRLRTEFLNQEVLIERIGTDGNLKKARSLLEELDGRVDALGLGGIDLYIRAGEKRYVFRDARGMIKNVTRTPVVDGSGLKDSLEKRIIFSLAREYQLDLSHKSVFLVCGVDRPGMAEALEELGASVTYGDLIFSLRLPLPIRSLQGLNRVASIVAPIVCRLPFKLVYPTGDKQESSKGKKRYRPYFQQAEVIAGDYHFIKRNSPERMADKIIITNTVTESDVEELRAKGVSMLITTTPKLEGRSFGSNVMEALLVALMGKGLDRMTEKEYLQLADEMCLKPRIEKLQS